uniref:Uncharacterized protein n=1 Tax=Anguilla anguilla TaxID=7936 RepID=A0A0E9QIW9_ANGAN
MKFLFFVRIIYFFTKKRQGNS